MPASHVRLLGVPQSRDRTGRGEFLDQPLRARDPARRALARANDRPVRGCPGCRRDRRGRCLGPERRGRRSSGWRRCSARRASRTRRRATEESGLQQCGVGDSPQRVARRAVHAAGRRGSRLGSTGPGRPAGRLSTRPGPSSTTRTTRPRATRRDVCRHRSRARRRHPDAPQNGAGGCGSHVPRRPGDSQAERAGPPEARAISPSSRKRPFSTCPSSRRPGAPPSVGAQTPPARRTSR